MRVIAAAIRNPIAVGVTVLLVCLFGALSLQQLPLQLFPDIERPTIGIFTNWRGASPEEAEAELLEPQERVLQGLSGLEEITGNANSGGTDIILTFAIGTDMKAALVDVIGRMSRLPPLPRDADRPVVQLGGYRRRQREPHLLFRAAAARHRGPDRQVPPLHRRRGAAADRIGSRRRRRTSQRRLAKRRAHHRRPGAKPRRSASAFRISPDSRPAPTMFLPASSMSAVGNTRCATPVAMT